MGTRSPLTRSVFHGPPSRGSLRMPGLGRRVMIVEQLERQTGARIRNEVVQMAERSVGELSEEVLEEIKKGQEAAIKAVRNFTETVDKTLAKESSPTQVEQIVDSALKMADQLVETQYTFLKKVVHSAGESLGEEGSSEEK